MGVRDTSHAALPKARKALSTLQLRIITELMLWPATRKELAERLGKPINCICAPVKALLEAGKIDEFVQGENTGTGRRAWLLRVKKEGTCTK